MKILMAFPGKIGDAIFFTSTIRHVHDHYSKQGHVVIDWVYGSPMLDNLVKDFLMNTDVPIRTYLPYKYGYHDDVPEWTNKKWEKEFPGYDMYCNCILNQAPPYGVHLIEWIPQRVGIVPTGIKLKTPAFKFATHLTDIGHNKILVHPWISSLDRNSDFLLQLNSEYHGSLVYSIGYVEEKVCSSAKDLRGLPYDQYIDLIRGARLVIGVSSSFTTLSAVFGVPTLVVHVATTTENCGMQRFGPHCLDLVRPSLSDINGGIDELLNMRR